MPYEAHECPRPTRCGPHQKAAEFGFRLNLIIEQMFLLSILF